MKMVTKEDIKEELNLMVNFFYERDENFNNADRTTRMRCQSEDEIMTDVKEYIKGLDK